VHKNRENLTEHSGQPARAAEVEDAARPAGNAKRQANRLNPKSIMKHHQEEQKRQVGNQEGLLSFLLNFHKLKQPVP
jgi:hypothetical protein